MELPTDVLAIILGRVVRRDHVAYDYVPFFPDRQARFLGQEEASLMSLRGSADPRWKEMFRTRPRQQRFSLTVDVDVAFQLAQMCKAFFRALRRLPDVRREVMRLDCVVGLRGSTYDGDRYPYFPARFCSEDHEYTKEVVDTMGFGLPCERSFLLDGKCVTVTFLHDASDNLIDLCDGFIFFYDFEDPKALTKLEMGEFPTVLRAKGWQKLQNSVLVSSRCPSGQPAVPVASAVALAQRLGMPHFQIHAPQRYAHPLTPEQHNVKEAVYAVARMIRPQEIVLASPTAPKEKKCVLM